MADERMVTVHKTTAIGKTESEIPVQTHSARLAHSPASVDVRSVHFVDVPAMQVALSVSVSYCCFELYLSTYEARQIAQHLIACAEHFDSEAARWEVTMADVIPNNKAHRTAFTNGRKARMVGRARMSPYDASSRSSAEFRRAWLAGYDGLPEPREMVEALISAMERSDLDFCEARGLQPTSDAEWDALIELGKLTLAAEVAHG